MNRKTGSALALVALMAMSRGASARVIAMERQTAVGRIGATMSCPPEFYDADECQLKTLSLNGVGIKFKKHLASHAFTVYAIDANAEAVYLSFADGNGKPPCHEACEQRLKVSWPRRGKKQLFTISDVTWEKFRACGYSGHEPGCSELSLIPLVTDPEARARYKLTRPEAFKGQRCGVTWCE